MTKLSVVIPVLNEETLIQELIDRVTLNCEKITNDYEVIVVDDKIVAVYMFRKSCVQIEKGMEVLSCFASISNVEDNIFIQGFKISFWKIAAENYFGFCAIEDISDNYFFINNIKLKTKPLVISPTAYFFYNFAYPTFKPNKVLIIN